MSNIIISRIYYIQINKTWYYINVYTTIKGYLAVAWWFLPVNYNYSRSRNMIGMLDTSAPGQIGTRTLRHLCETFRYQDNSAPQLDKLALVFFSLILRTKLLIVLNQFQILIMFVPILILIHNLYDAVLICSVTELSWCRTVFFNGAEMSWCRTVLFSYDCIKLTPVIAWLNVYNHNKVY